MTRVAFEFSRNELDSHTSVIAFEGYLDLASAPKLKWMLVEELDAGRRIVLDLSLVTFMDSTALGVLVGISRNLSADGVLAIAAASPAVLRILEVTGLDRTFDLFPTLDAAVSSLQTKPSGLQDTSKTPVIRSAAGSQPAVDRPGKGTGSSSAEGAEVPISLTGDAAVVLGLAGTAMPFSRSSGGQAERWLRILSRYGDAARLLASLGIVDDPVGRKSEHDVEDGPGRRTERDPVAAVTRHARRIAEARGATAVHTSDLLGAVIEVYGEAVDQALAQHGITSAELIERLGHGRPGHSQA